MKPEYEPTTLDQRLGYLTEEGGEAMAALGNLLQAVGKSQRWGIESSSPELPPEEREPNRLWLLRLIAPLKVELQDLAEAVERVEVALQCNHKFVDSDRCLKCGCTFEELKRGCPNG